MNKEFTRQKNARYDFSKLIDETNYNCEGSGCSCKYLHDRSTYDQQQYSKFKIENDIDYGKNMFISFKKKF